MWWSLYWLCVAPTALHILKNPNLTGNEWLKLYIFKVSLIILEGKNVIKNKIIVFGANMYAIWPIWSIGSITIQNQNVLYYDLLVCGLQIKYKLTFFPFLFIYLLRILFTTDINECGLPIRPCSHRCMNTMGSYHCFCNHGYMLDTDGKSCIGMANYLWWTKWLPDSW